MLRSLAWAGICALFVVGALLARLGSRADAAATCGAACYVDAVNGNDNNIGTSANPLKTIQAGIDAVDPGGTVYVYPGAYDETAANRSLFDGSGPYQFGLFIGQAKSGITIQGLDANGIPITAYAAAQAAITTNATNAFGPSGIYVEGDSVTIAGVRVGANSPTNNRTIEVTGDNFTLADCVIAVPSGGRVAFNDPRFDGVNNVAHIQQYTLSGTLFGQGASIALTNGAGYSGPVSGRVIQDNVFDLAGLNGPAVDFTGSGTGLPGLTYSVGGAVIKNNQFQNAASVYIRAQGAYDNTGFDWAGYWNTNVYDKAAIVGANPPAVVSPYSYTGGATTFTNVRHIAAAIQSEINDGQPGDTVLVHDGVYPENLVITKSISLLGAQANVLAKNRPGPESIIKPAASAAAVDIRADNVIVNGFTFDMAGLTPSWTVTAISKPGGGRFNAVQLLYNHFQGNPATVGQSEPGGAYLSNQDNARVEGNFFDALGSYGVYLAQSSNNAIYRQNDSANTYFAHLYTHDLTHTGLLAEGNRADSDQMVLFGVKDATIQNNSFTGSASGAARIALNGGNRNVLVKGNTFQAVRGQAILAADAGLGYGANDTLTVSENSVTTGVGLLAPASAMIDLRGVAGVTSVTQNSVTIQPSAFPGGVTSVYGIRAGGAVVNGVPQTLGQLTIAGNTLAGGVVGGAGGSGLPVSSGIWIDAGVSNAGPALSLSNNNVSGWVNGITLLNGSGAPVTPNRTISVTANNIQDNSGIGVAVGDTGANAPILGNAIYNNGLLGIDLNLDGVTPNDPLDTDSGANRLLNYPTLASAVSDGAQTTVVGTLNSAPSANFRIEFFGNPAADASGYGEGKTYLGAISVTTDGIGNASFTATSLLPVLVGYSVSATASVQTTAPNPVVLYTSEFSANVTVGAMATPTSTATVTPTATPPACSVVSLTGLPALPVSGGTWPVAVVAADFNKDGALDLAAANYIPGNVTAYLGNGSGGFSQAGAATTTGSGARALAVGDFNADSFPDLAVANLSAGTVSILLGAGNGTFSQPNPAIITGGGAALLAAADVNNDGRLDLVVPNSTSSTLRVLLGNGDGTFNALAPIVVGTGPYAVAIGDLDGDGKLDLAVGFNTGSSVALLKGSGTGTFTSLGTAAVGLRPVHLLLRDFNRDGKLDLATADNGDGTVSILYGKGNGTFDARIPIPIAYYPRYLDAADLNRDGDLDLVVTTAATDTLGTGGGTNGVTILPSNGQGGFALPSAPAALGGEAWWAIAPDLDGDERPDVVAAVWPSNQLALFRNTCGLPTATPTLTPTVTPTPSITPTPTMTATGAPSPTATRTPTPSTVTVVVDASGGGWSLQQENPIGTGAFVPGPSVPPLNLGSAQLTVNGTGRSTITTGLYAGTRLDQLTQLLYHAYTRAGGPANAATLELDIDYNLTDPNLAPQGHLVYDPTKNGAVTLGLWQTWSALNGVWYATEAPGLGVCPPAAPCTLGQVLLAFPNAGIRAGVTAPGDPPGRIGFAAGPIGAILQTNVDAFVIGVNSASRAKAAAPSAITITTYDFEPVDPTAAQMRAFDATADGSRVTLRWETLSEVGLLGFRVWCSARAEGQYAPVGPALIPAQLSPGGAAYTWQDVGVPDGVWAYKLELVSAAGQSLGMVGPTVVAVEPGAGGAPAYRLFIPRLTLAP